MPSAATIAVAAILVVPALAAPLTAEQRLAALSARKVSAKPAAPKSSGSGIGKTIAGGAASGAGSAIVSNILGEIESHFRRDELEQHIDARDAPFHNPLILGEPVGPARTHLPKFNPHLAVARRSLADLSPEEQETVKNALINKVSSMSEADIAHFQKRAPKNSKGSGVGTAVAGGAASGAGSAIVKGLISVIGDLFRRDELEQHMDTRAVEFEGGPFRSPITLGEPRGPLRTSLPKLNPHLAIGKRSLDDLSPEEQETVKNALIDKVSTMSKADLAHFQKRAPKGSSKGSGIGKTIAGGVASGASSAAVGGILGAIENLFRRDDFEGGEGDLHEFEKRKGSGIASSIAGSAASGAGNAVVTNVLQGIEGLFHHKNGKRALADLSPEDQETVKNALINKVSSMSEADLAHFQKRAAKGSGIGKTIKGGPAVSVIPTPPNSVWQELRNSGLFSRSEELEIDELD